MTVNQIQLPPDEDRGTTGGAGSIETYTGVLFDPSEELPAYNLEDIAHALGMCVRYNGHVNNFYSVAEHCVLVSRIMQDKSQSRELGFEGLMHDALEAYLSDVPAPFKPLLPDYKALDDKLERSLRAHFLLNEDKSPLCKTADWLALFIEADKLMHSRGKAFSDPLNLRPQALAMRDQYPIRCWDPETAKRQFIDRYEELNRVA